MLDQVSLQLLVVLAFYIDVQLGSCYCHHGCNCSVLVGRSFVQLGPIFWLCLAVGWCCLLGCSGDWLASRLGCVVGQLGLFAAWVYLVVWVMLVGYIHNDYGQTRT